MRRDSRPRSARRRYAPPYASVADLGWAEGQRRPFNYLAIYLPALTVGRLMPTMAVYDIVVTAIVDRSQDAENANNPAATLVARSFERQMAEPRLQPW